MRTIVLMPLVLVLIGAVGPSRSPSPLIGAWRLVSFESRDGNGTVTQPMGSEPIGQLMYDATGSMSVHLMRPKRAPFASGDRLEGTDEEIRAALEGYHAYFGDYEIDDQAQVVTHHIVGASFPNLVGSKQARAFTVDGKRLTLSTPPITVGARSLTSTLVWARVERGAAQQ